MSWTPDRDVNGNFIIRTGAFSSTEGMKFRGTGISTTVPNGTTHNFDYQLTENRFINGIHLILKNHVFGDTVSFQVVDKDGIMAPAGTVLDEFGKDWNVSDETQSQGEVSVSYPALIITGLYIRIVYKSTGATDVLMRVNLFLHKKP